MPSSEIPNNWRVFVAIELPLTLRRKLIEHLERLRSKQSEVRASWSHEENLHVTLKFLGDIPVTRVEALAQAAQSAASTVEPFQMLVGGCGVFPPRGQPRVLWVGVEDPSGRLALLHQTLEDECAKAGFPREPRPFLPHLTTARIRKPNGAPELAVAHLETEFAREAIAATGLSVIRSELWSSGSRYTTLSRHAFSAAK